MGLCSLEDVKLRLGIPLEDTTYDRELELLIEEASEIAVAVLGEDWPSLDDVPRLVRYATANIAAGLFKRLRGPSSEETPLYELGLEELEFYKRHGKVATKA